MTQPPPRVPVDDIIVAPEPAPETKTARATDALMSLSQTLALSPGSAVQRLVEEAMRLTKSGSAGVSLEDTEDGQPVFRWIATSGEFDRYRDGTMPRDFSPCGETLARGHALLMREPGRHYGYITQMHVPVHAALLVPFSSGGKLVGTLWCVAHRPAKTFSDRDVRTVQDLTTFATAIIEARRRQDEDAAR